ncbi:MAG: ABC transporter permease, partial [Deltaproteobacteria bacterium]|nr:ABC transporter permease [Deltaproteobacteria bacterium]
MKRIAALIDHLGKSTLVSVEEIGKIILLFLSVLMWMVRPPLKAKNIFKQMEFVGVKSIFVVVLTGTFTGMVLALQSYHGF